MAKLLRRLRTGLRVSVDKAASFANWSTSITINGRRYAVPVLGGIRVRKSEDWMTDLLAELLAERQGAFVDVGANLGQTMLKVCAIDPERPYIGFEPNPVCVGYLRHLIARNGLTNCSIIPIGIGAHPHVAGLDLYHDVADSSASIIPAFRKGAIDTVPVPVMSEAELSLPDAIAVLKIDVEGGELGVINGLRSTIARTQPAISVEILPARSSLERIERQEHLEAILLGMNYQIYRVVKSNGRLTKLEPVTNIGIDRNMAEVDFLFSPTA